MAEVEDGRESLFISLWDDAVGSYRYDKYMNNHSGVGGLNADDLNLLPNLKVEEPVKVVRHNPLDDSRMFIAHSFCNVLGLE